MKKIITLVLIFISMNTFAQELKPMPYKVDDKAFTGYYCMPKEVNELTKTILIVHEWWGLNDYPKERAIQLANEGFIAVCIDMYGTNVLADNPGDAGKLAGAFYANPNLGNQIFTAGLTAAKKIEGVNADRMAAIGYCFGGNIVLNAAKMGAPLDAIVSFHGNLNGPALEKNKMVSAVLVCNGAADKFVPQIDIDNLKADMTKNNADYTFINYDDALHAFTNPNSTAVGKKFGMPIAYNENAANKSYYDFMTFIAKKVK